MRAQQLWRKVHYWLAIISAVPLLLVITSGILLQVKKEFHWIQPNERRGDSSVPAISFEQILEACKASPEVEVESWDDIDRIDLRPGKKLLKVTTQRGEEIQIDPADGEVLQVAARRSDTIEALHDGSWFGDFVKYWVFLPSGIMLAILWGTGLYLFFVPLVRQRRSQP